MQSVTQVISLVMAATALVGAGSCTPAPRPMASRASAQAWREHEDRERRARQYLIALDEGEEREGWIEGLEAARRTGADVFGCPYDSMFVDELQRGRYRVYGCAHEGVYLCAVELSLVRCRPE